jgi:diguanylate cyclase (GGDEF)-like protein
MEEAQRSHADLSVLHIGLDHFSKLSQELGHDACDSIVRACGARMKERLRPVDTLARAGGGEFLVLLPGLSCEVAIKTVGEGLLRAVAEKFQMALGEVDISASMGCACFPQHASDVPTLMRHASASLYNASPFLT